MISSLMMHKQEIC